MGDYPTADLDALRTLAARIRLTAVELVAIEGMGYLGQALSSAEIFAVLFGAGHAVPGRDRFVLSPGHYALALYAVAAELGLLPEEELVRYGQDGALLEAISTERTPVVDLTCGSLAQGLSGAIGFALSDRFAGREGRVVAFLSDGELEEGQTWEAAMFAANAGLDRLVAVLDANGSQVDGPVDSVTTIEPIAAKWEAFGWQTLEVDGHDVAALDRAIRRAGDDGRPTIVIARTDIFGRLSTFAEHHDGHFIKVDRELRAALLDEIGPAA